MELFCSVFKTICVHTYRFRPSTLQRGSREKPHGSVCPPFWILTVEWSGARLCLFLMASPFSDIASFSPSTLENSVFKKHRFQITPLWRAFSNGFVFGDRLRRCSVDDSRIRSKTTTFSFENGLVWTGPWFTIIFAHIYEMSSFTFNVLYLFTWPDKLSSSALTFQTAR